MNLCICNGFPRFILSDMINSTKVASLSKEQKNVLLSLYSSLDGKKTLNKYRCPLNTGSLKILTHTSYKETIAQSTLFQVINT